MKNPAKYLDQILKILAKDFENPMTIQEIQNKITPVNLFGIPGDVTFSLDSLTDTTFAINYLNSLEFIIINPFDRKISITFKGYIKIKTNGFAKEIKDKSTNQTLQRIAWTLPIIISILALIISLSKS